MFLVRFCCSTFGLVYIAFERRPSYRGIKASYRLVVAKNGGEQILSSSCFRNDWLLRDGQPGRLGMLSLSVPTVFRTRPPVVVRTNTVK